jgi:hypothetical protein
MATEYIGKGKDLYTLENWLATDFVCPCDRKALVLKHWQEHRPKMFAALVKAGTLDKAMDEALAATREAEHALWKQGMTSEEAWRVVQNDFLFLPDEETMPNLGEGETGLPL